jgi:hypothetical protein
LKDYYINNSMVTNTGDVIYLKNESIINLSNVCMSSSVSIHYTHYRGAIYLKNGTIIN